MRRHFFHLLGVLLLFVMPVQASILTWTGVSDNDVNNLLNWNPNGTPSASGTLIFTGTNRLDPQISIATAAALILFDASADIFTLGGSGSYTLNDGIINNSTLLQTINNDLILSNAQAFNNTASGGALVLNGNINNGGFLVTISGTGNTTTTINGSLSGTGGLTKQGNGTLTLSGSSSFSGGVIINAGRLEITTDESLGDAAGSVTIQSGELAFENELSSSRSIVLDGIGTLDTGDNTVTLSSSSVVSGTGSLTKIGTGILILAGTNSYEGTTDIVEGTLAISSSSLGAGQVTIENGTLEVTANLTQDREIDLASDSSIIKVDSGVTYTNAGVISGWGGLTKTGAGTLSLGNANTYEGDTTISAGTLIASGADSLGNGSSLAIGNGVLEVAANMTSTRAIELTSASSTIKVDSGITCTNAGEISGAGNLTKTGAGTLALADGNSYDGDTTISAGTLVVNGPSSLGAGDLYIGNGTLEAASEFISTDHIILTHAASTIKVNADIEFETDGVISGTGGLTKTGAGNLNIGNTMIYSGATTVTSGSLTVLGSCSLANTSSVVVASNATLIVDGSINHASLTTVSGTLQGSGSLGDVLVASGGHVSPGESPGIITMGSLSLSGPDAHLDFELGGLVPGLDYDQIITSGPVSLNNGTLHLTLQDNYLPTHTNRLLLILNGDATQTNIGTFNGITDNSHIFLTNNYGTFGFSAHYADYDNNGTTDFYLAGDNTVTWGKTEDADPLEGILDGSIIPLRTGTNEVRYVNVNGQGYDVVVVTGSGTGNSPDLLTKSGYSVLPWDDSVGTWWFQGPTASSGGKPIPYGTVEFHFYRTGTVIPFGLTGIKFKFEDAENGERFRNFGYWNARGTEFTDSFTDPSIFTFSSGDPNEYADDSVDSGSTYEPGSQEGKWIEVDLSAMAISGFTFQAGRYNPSKGSVLMTGLGEDVIPTGELLIQSGTDQNVTAGPDFVTTSENAILTPDSIVTSLDASDVTISTDDFSQNIVINNNVISSSGHSLSLEASQNILSGIATSSTGSLITTSDTGNAGAINLDSGQSTLVDTLNAASSAANGGAVSIIAGNDILISSGIDTSSNHAGSTGGDVTLSAGGSLSAITIRTGGGGGVSRAGSPGDIHLSSGESITVHNIYADSGTSTSPDVSLTAPVINLGVTGTAPAAEIEGTLHLQKALGSSGATVNINAPIAGSGSMIVDVGTGTVNLNASATLTGETQMNSGILAAHGNSLANSDLILSGSSQLTPGVTGTGGYVSLNTFTAGANTTLNVTLTSDTIFDQVRSAGVATLNGIFNLLLGAGYVPDIGVTFDVMTFGSYSGDFTSYEGMRLDDRVLIPVLSSTNLVLVTSTISSGASQPLQFVPETGYFVPAGGYYDGLIVTATTSSLIPAATIIGGTASSDTTVFMQLLDAGAAGFLPGSGLSGNIFSINGTGSDKYVLQLDYNEDAVIATLGDENNLFMTWSNGVLPFTNAVDGNTDLPGEVNTPTVFHRAYNPDTDFHLGYYGVDTVNNRVWAVLDHNSYVALGSNETPAFTGPTTSTQDADGLTPTTAILNALVNPNGFDATVHFEWSTNPNLSGFSATPGISIGSGSSFVLASSTLTSLIPSATYYYRAVSVTDSGTETGDILSFTTQAPPVVTVSATVPNAYEFGPSSGTFCISQSGSFAVTVHYAISGSAVNGSRYTIASVPVTIPEGCASVLLDVTPIPNNLPDGDQTVILTISPDVSYAIGSPSSAAVTIHDKPADQWKTAWFGDSANNPAISDDTVANNSAGIKNLMAYALGLNPLSATADQLPVLEIVQTSGTNYLALSFTRNTTAVDIVYTVEASSDLTHWSSVSTWSAGAWSPSDLVTETGAGPSVNVTVQDSTPVSGSSMRFLRLKITH